MYKGVFVNHPVNNGQITDVWSWTITRGKDQHLRFIEATVRTLQNFFLRPLISKLLECSSKVAKGLSKRHIEGVGDLPLQETLVPICRAHCGTLVSV